ncbi:hypothetical protein HXX76_015706 [Chlamydomonas incerta]|uniref:Peptidase M50 domain-containing protein n=1 Tax=Chlamydomonas incerta TaxID=51695 RepID=A0A835VPF9_CHLIN|nr:hypothetical protein HXX76_015706 [Chlamydomonas incerta]|eukprot:KAG2422875.1 hypothetical protein HXX76_015706 [Chlamydomonas incerta]
MSAPGISLAQQAGGALGRVGEILAKPIPLGQLFSIPIELHASFFIVLGLQLLTSIPQGGWAVLLWSLVLGPMLLATVLIHELGHCLAARQVGAHVSGILLWPLGGLAFIGQTPSPKADAWVALAGPLTHIPQVLVWLLLLLPVYHADTGSWAVKLYVPYPEAAHFLHALFACGVIINISLFAFNLLVPAYPLDGGRLLVDGLLWAGVAPRRTAWITICVAVPLGLGVMVYGFYPHFQMVTIMVAGFILFATFQLFQALRADALPRHPLFAAAYNSGGAAAGATGGAGAGGHEGPYFKFDSVVVDSAGVGVGAAGAPPAQHQLPPH